MKGFLHLRGNTYYFRCRVPHDLYDMFSQRREVVKSLHTRDKRLAKPKHMIVAAFNTLS